MLLRLHINCVKIIFFTSVNLPASILVLNGSGVQGILKSGGKQVIGFLVYKFCCLECIIGGELYPFLKCIFGKRKIVPVFYR